MNWSCIGILLFRGTVIFGINELRIKIIRCAPNSLYPDLFNMKSQFSVGVGTYFLFSILVVFVGSVSFDSDPDPTLLSNFDTDPKYFRYGSGSREIIRIWIRNTGYWYIRKRTKLI